MEQAENYQPSNTNLEEESSINPDGFFNDLKSQNACSVRVAVRVRPLVGRELYEGQQRTCVESDPIGNKVIIGDKNFQFDKVFHQESSQESIFDICGKNLVLGCFSGFNATILAYGQTGSGKTHTMGTSSTVGLPSEQIGIVPRVFGFIFEELQRRKQQSQASQFTIKCSFLELYNEELHDLLDPTTIGAYDRITGKALKELQIREEKNGAISIQGLKEEIVQSREECLTLLNKGIAHRTTSATLMNEGSSRSHAIFTVAIEQRIIKDLEAESLEDNKEAVPSAQEEHITAKFHFVDLAGSERIKKTGATGQVMKEGISINKGLLALGNVISALTEESKKQVHIPYRDSKLTRILQDSLGGNSRTTMIACVSPAESNYEESLNSLKYASRARNIKNKPVVNRDPNSLLIESLRTQITSLQSEIKEYQTLLKDNNIDIPDDFQQTIQKKAEQTRSVSSPSKQPQQQNQILTIPQSLPLIQHGNSMNFQELRDLKIKLSKKEKELKDVQEQLDLVLKNSKVKDEEMQLIVKERDSLRLKNEIMSEVLEKNNLKIDNLLQSDQEKQTLSLIEEYQAKIQQMEKELQKKDQELQIKSREIGKLLHQTQTDEELLRKHLEENQKLKRQMKKFEEQGFVKKEDQSTEKKKRHSQLNELIKGDLINEKFLNSFASQLESLFVSNEIEEGGKISCRSQVDKHMTFDENEKFTSLDKQQLENEESIVQVNNSQIDEKEKILEAVKQSAKKMQGELVELMQHEYEKKIQAIESDLVQTDIDRANTIKKVSPTDQKQLQLIEKEYKTKMEELQKQLSEFKDKEKKQESVTKQIQSQEAKIKTLESDIQKVKKNKEQVEKQMKTETEKFSKYKKNVAQELTQAKKSVIDKDKVLQKLRQDLKKTDQLAQNKLAELRGLKKKTQEERMKREQMKQLENEKKGIDIDRIKNWINENTQKMLKVKDLKEQLENQLDERERIEDEMLAIGDRLTDLIIEKERKEIEKSQLESEIEQDEGKMLEIEEEIDKLNRDIDNITEQLDSKDQTLDFVNKKINTLSEEVAANDMDNIEPIQFNGLKSVDAAKATLSTFFLVLLDLNIYKRDLEQKCIEQDETVLALNEKITLLQIRIDELISNGMGIVVNPNASSQEATNRIVQLHKEKALKSIVDSLEGYVEFNELKNLNLTPNEQNSLTKLSLSKIVSNLKSKLKEEESKNLNLSHKLEQAINEKEQYKLKFDNLKKQKKQEENPMLSSRGNNSFISQSTTIQKQPSSLSISQNSNGVPNNNSKLEFKFKSRLQQSKVGDTQNASKVAIKQQNTNHSRNNTILSQASAQQPLNKVNIVQKKTLQPSSSSVTRENNLNNFSRQIKTPRKKEPREGSLQAKEIKMSFGNSQQQEQALTNLRDKRTQKKISNEQVLSQSFAPYKSNELQIRPLTSLKEKRDQEQDKPAANKVTNLKDRRNQRKIEIEKDLLQIDRERSDSNNDISTYVDSKIQEIERIKESSQLLAQEHKERKKSKVRTYKSLNNKQQDQQQDDENLLMNDNNILIEEDLIQETPKQATNLQISPNKLSPFNIPKLDISRVEDNQYQIKVLDLQNDDQEETIMQDEPMPIMSPSKDQRNKWIKEDLMTILKKDKLVGFDCVNNKFMMIFQNFDLCEYDLETSKEIKSINLLQQCGQESEQANGFTIDKELGLIAVIGVTGVYLYDYQDEYILVNKIQVENIKDICFCQFFLIALQEIDGSQGRIVSFQFDEEPEEKGQYLLNNISTIMKSDGQHIYFTYENYIGKLSVPDMNQIFYVKTEHSNSIIDFAFSQQIIFITSKDLSLRGIDIETGDSCIQPIEELECDHLETDGSFILTRCAQGAAFLVWKQLGNFSSELTLIDELELEQYEQEIIDFKMKGHIEIKQYDLYIIQINSYLMKDNDSKKKQINDKIDKFMDQVIEKVNQRRETLKQEFKQIEAREKRRIKSKQMKLEKDLQEVKSFCQEYQEFLNDFDSDMDYLANKASLDGYVTDLQQLEQDSKKPTQFLKTSEYQNPTFSSLQSDLELIEQFGKITDNSDFSMPLTTFNSETLQCFGYNEKLKDFIELKIQDEANYIQAEVPRFFKSMYIPDDRFILVGGLERNNSQSSARTFLIDDKGRLSPQQDMLTARQYFAFCTDYQNEFVYAIAGYNNEIGLLKSVEKFSFKARKWISVEPINHGRVNAAACKCGTKYIYLFGGLDNRDFLDSIERFNLTLDIWTVLKIKLPQRMANFYTFSLNPDHIVILGGMKKKQEEFIPSESRKKYELENRVFVLKTTNFKWKDLKPFPFKKKLGNVVYNGYGKFFCYVIENNMELPQLFVYDVRSCFPQFDKYWENDKEQKEGLQKIKGKDIKVYLANMKQNQTKKYYQINDNSTPVLLTDQQQTYSQNGTMQISPFAKGKSIEMKSIKLLSSQERYGHWTYECKNENAYLYRPSRTTMLKNPELVPEPVFEAGPKTKITDRDKKRSTLVESSSESESSDDQSEEERLHQELLKLIQKHKSLDKKKKDASSESESSSENDSSASKESSESEESSVSEEESSSSESESEKPKKKLKNKQRRRSNDKKSRSRSKAKKLSRSREKIRDSKKRIDNSRENDRRKHYDNHRS